MKKQLFCLMMLFCLKANAQKYYPLIRENVTWEIWGGNSMEICVDFPKKQCFFKGDTAINNKIYKKIYAYYAFSKIKTPFCPPFFIDNSQAFLDGFMREDTLERKVYIYDENKNKEGIIYDFNLKKGDTMTYEYAVKGMPVRVDSIGIITLKNNQTRNITYLSNRQFYIEGIGGSAGIQLPYIQYIGYWTALACYRENNINVFSGINDCLPYLLSSKNLENQTVINISPNPFNNNLNISINSDENIDVKIFDIFSKKIMQQSFQQNINLDVSMLPRGSYFYQLSSKNGLLKVGKLIKAN